MKSTIASGHRSKTALAAGRCAVAILSVAAAIWAMPATARGGTIHSAPVGWSTLSRNIILGCVAGFVVWRGRGHANLGLTDLFGGFQVSQAFLAGGVLFTSALLTASAVLLFQVIRQQGHVLLRLESIEDRLSTASLERAGKDVPPSSHGLPVGSRAPSFSLNRPQTGVRCWAMT